MAVREFTDARGVAWRAWDITPDSVRPRTRTENYLAASYAEGWLVFERVDEREKRRLASIPAAWHELPLGELEKLLGRAEIVPPRRRARDSAGAVGQDPRPQPAQPDGRHRPASADGDGRADGRADLADLDVMRTFHFPGGRIWTVCIRRPGTGEGAPVLRFTSGRRSIDAREWPHDWADLPEEQLAELLRRAAPREKSWSEGAPQRRHDDPRGRPAR